MTEVSKIDEALTAIKSQVETKFENVAKAEDVEAKADKAELEKKADKEFVEVIKAENAALKETVEALEAKFDAFPTPSINNNKDKTMDSITKAFEAEYEKSGSYQAEVMLKAITETSPITGAPVQTFGLSGARFAANPVRSLSRNIAVSTSSITLPRKNGNHAAATANLTNKAVKTTGTAAVEEITINAKTIEALSEISVEAGADIVGFDAFWSQDMINELAAKEAADHVVAVEALTNGVTTAANTAVALDDFANLIFDVAPQYRTNGAMVVSTGAMQSLRTLNQSGTGSDLVFDAQLGSFRLFGYPIYENAYMADVAATNVVAAFGDWNAGLTLINRASAQVGRNPFTKPGRWTYYADMRSGIGEVDTGALRKLTMKA